MSPEPLVSVCMPLYNAAPFLREAIEGVLRQSYEHLELIICDNRSTDGSLEIAEEYAAKDARVRVEPNRRGIGFAGNLHKVTQLARGDLMIVHCADDTAEPTALDKLVALSQRPDVDPERSIFLSDAYRIDGDSIRTGALTHEPGGFDNIHPTLERYEATGAIERFRGRDALSYALARLHTVGFLGAIMYPRALFTSVEGVYNGLLYGPDKEYMYSLLSQDPELIWLREPLFSWRVHEGGQAPQERNLAVIRAALDAYVLTFQYPDAFLQRYGTSRAALREPFVDEYCLRKSLAGIRDGDRLLAFRYLCFALATYPRVALRNKKFYAALGGYLTGPLGRSLARAGYRRGIWRRPNRASEEAGRP